METYHGLVRTLADAIILFEACRSGFLPRVQRRLSEKERQAIKSGSVFVWFEPEAGMRRWTDGKSWSASRVSGSFLTYREMEGKRGGGVSMSRTEKTPDSRGNSDDDRDGSEDGPDGYRYKPDGLIKQSFSITTSAGQHLHLISYYTRSHPTAPNSNRPSTDPALRHIRLPNGLYPESTVNDQQTLSVVTRGPVPGTMTLSPPLHMAGLPRNGATHPQSDAPLYTWPPTPLATPPTATVPYHPGPAYLPPLPGASPYGQPAPHPQGPSPLAPHHQLPTPSERPPRLDTTLPPPLRPGTISAPIDPGYPTRSPRPGLMSMEAQRRHPPNYVSKASLPVRIDPRLMSPPIQTQPGHSSGNSPSPRQPLTPNPSHLPPPHVHEAPGSGATVPSLVTWVSNRTAFTFSKLNGSPASLRAGGPRDIPSDNIIEFGREDMRALRQLDRIFTA